ncbi:MAG: amidohydrolase family protein [Chloroflexi bacterium]|nr:amidohydrolase family protein [Chloroflexota bacterium]
MSITGGSPAISTLIEGGLVVDGSGSPGFHAAIAVVEGGIRILRGDVREVAAARRIDATGRVVCPGFIDPHSHSALVVLDEPTLAGKLLQGVTTEVVGVDGLGYAPFPDLADLRRFVALNSGIDGDPDLAYDWTDVAGYLDRVDRQVSPNIATFVGNTALRVAAVGWDDAPADGAALRAQQQALRTAMEQGALGLSTGLDYPPGGYATTEELVALAEVAAAHGGIYHTHVRYSLGDAYLDPFREALDIGRRSGIPVHVTHFSRSSRSAHPGGARAMLELLETARDEGLDVTFDTYPYEWGGTRLMRLLPDWLQAGGPDRMRERLADVALRPRLREAVETSGAYRAYVTSRPFADVRLTNLRRPEHAHLDGRTLAEVAAADERHIADVIADLLLAEDLRVTFVRPSPQGTTLPAFVAHPLSMIATDSVLIGSLPSPRAFGSYPRVLGDYVREERVLSLPDAIRRMTSFPAARLGLVGRGLLVDGAAADIVVFDPATVRATATYEQPRQAPIGIEHVLVDGVSVVDGSRHTGATPGRALRLGRATID